MVRAYERLYVIHAMMRVSVSGNVMPKTQKDHPLPDDKQALVPIHACAVVTCSPYNSQEHILRQGQKRFGSTFCANKDKPHNVCANALRLKLQKVLQYTIALQYSVSFRILHGKAFEAMENRSTLYGRASTC